MRLVAKKGSAFEQTLKEMCETITKGFDGALDLVESAIGVRPKHIYRQFHWGIVSKLVPEFVFDDKDTNRIPPKCLRKFRGSNDVWVPTLRYAQGRKLEETFREFAKQYIVRDEPLNEYGIHMVDEVNRMSYSMCPFYDEERDRYILVCSDSTPKAFDKKKLAEDQFDIEY